MKSLLLRMSVALALETVVWAQPESYVLELGPGFNAVANHLDLGDNSLDEIFPLVPDGALLIKFDRTTQTFSPPAEYSVLAGWLEPNTFVATLSPGEGAFLQVPSAVLLPMFGAYHAPQARGDVGPGTNFVSCQTTQTCGFTELMGVAPIVGDVVYKFDRAFTAPPPSLWQAASSVHTFGSNGWDVVPQFTIGKSAFVLLSGAPRITLQPANQSVLIGLDATLSGDAMGAGPLYFQWLFRGLRIPGANDKTLDLGGVELFDAGYYSLVVSNASGSVTSAPALVRVFAPPAITQQPQGLIAIAGEPAALGVSAAGTPPLEYQWNFNGVDLSGATSASLEFSSLQPADAGNYFVTVTNPYGAVFSDVVTLAVLLPPTITSQPGGQTIDAGSTVTLSVEAAGTAPLVYQWRLNGVNIPDATNSAFTLTNAPPAESGFYLVTVANVVGAADSLPAILRVTVPGLPLSDHFAASLVVGNPSRDGRASNVGATQEAGEPNHDGKVGGSSVWISWVAPAQGIATFSTSGSSFDTLLAAYLGASVSTLTEVASDDDSGGYHTSEISFNTTPGAEYHIAVDGLNGEQGDVLLSWDLERTTDSLPLILEQPQSQAAAFASDASFSVVAVGDGLSYQWFFNGVAIPGADQPDLMLAKAQDEEVGAYFARVYSGNRFVDSREALLQFSLAGPGQQVQDVFTADKFADVVIRPGAAPSLGFRLRQPKSGSLVLGYTGSQVFNTSGATKDENEPNHCGIPGGASHWFAYIAPAAGRLFLNTDGSTFDTVLAVYTGAGTTYASLIPVACDDNSGANGLTSALSFPASSGVIYYIVVDGVNGATGIVHLNYRLLIPMVLSHPAKTNSFHFRVSATPSVDFTVQRSTDLQNWMSLLTTNSASGVFDFLDETTWTWGSLFYRTTQAP
jgi:hypothetical protein